MDDNAGPTMDEGRPRVQKRPRETFRLPDDAINRGRRFMARRAAWRAGPQRFYGVHARIEPYAGPILAAMFNRALMEVGPVKVYILCAWPLGENVRLNGENWVWSTLGGTCEGRGLFEMWAWRFDRSIWIAASEIWALCRLKADKAGAGE